MGICGYNGRIGEAMRQLALGMFEAVSDKARSEGIELVDVLKREMIEVPRITSRLTGHGHVHLEMFAGLNRLALPYFEELLNRHERTGSLSEADFVEVVEGFIQVIDVAERYNMTLPPGDWRDMQRTSARADQFGGWVLSQTTTAAI